MPKETLVRVVKAEDGGLGGKEVDANVSPLVGRFTPSSTLKVKTSLGRLPPAWW